MLFRRANDCPRECVTPCPLVETTTSLSYEGGWVEHLAPKSFLQSDLLLVHHVGFGREEGGEAGGMGEWWGKTCLLGGGGRRRPI